MLKAFLRWSTVILCVLAVGPLASLPLSRVQDADGGGAFSLLISGSIPSSLGAGLLVIVAALVCGVVAARTFSAGIGFACAGLVMAWGAWRVGTTQDIIRRAHGGGDLLLLSVENALVVLLACGIVLAMHLVTRARDAKPGTKPSLLAHLATDGQGNASPSLAIVAILASGAGGAVAAYFGAATFSKGQAVFAAWLGGIVGGLAAQFAAGAMRGSITPVCAALGLTIPALAGPLVAQQMHGTSLLSAMLQGSFFPLGRIVSLDWATGVLLGVPVGLGWAGAMLDERAQHMMQDGSEDAAQAGRTRA